MVQLNETVGRDTISGPAVVIVQEVLAPTANNVVTPINRDSATGGAFIEVRYV